MRTSSNRSPFSKVAGTLGIALTAAATMAATALPAGASSPRVAAPAVTSFVTSSKAVTQFGGKVSITAKVRNSTTCAITISPAVSVAPSRGSCAKGTFSSTATFLANATTKMQSFTITLTATGHGAAKAVTKVTVANITASVPLASGPQLQAEQLHGQPTSISCSSAGNCVVVDANGAVVNQVGGVWSAAQSLGSDVFTAVSCATSSFCVATTQSGGVATYNGSSWSGPVQISSATLTAVSCPLAGSCVAADQSGAVLTLSGGVWSAPTNLGLGGVPTAISCTAAGNCTVVDSAGNAATALAGVWSVTAAIDDAGINAISCVDWNTCVAADGQGRVLVRSGNKWSAPQAADPDGAPVGLSCKSVHACVIADASGNTYVSTVDVFTGPVATGLDNVVGLSCAQGSCAVVSSTGNVVTSANRTTWSAVSSVDGDAGLITAITCMSPTSCMAVDDAGNALTFNGNKWSGPTKTHSSGLSAVSCAPGLCMAVGSDGKAVALRGGVWTSAVVSSAPLSGVACPASNYCIAVDTAGAYATWNGTSWSKRIVLETTLYMGFTAVSCSSVSFCGLADGTGHISIVTPGKPVMQEWVNTANESLSAISCTSSNTCFAVTPLGNVSSVSHTSKWIVTKQANIDSYGLVSISCTSVNSCIALDTQGQVVERTGTIWHSPVATPLSQSGSALSCSLQFNCVEIGSNNQSVSLRN